LIPKAESGESKVFYHKMCVLSTRPHLRPPLQWFATVLI
jgi:hypothetical protein